MSLTHIIKQGPSIHIFDGIIEIHRESDNLVIMTSVEEGTLLKLNNTPSTTQSVTNSTLLVKQNNLLPSSLLWHAIFGNINYNNIRIMKEKGIKGLPTIPRNLKSCHACILVKHYKQPFHSSVSRSSRK